MPKSYLGISSDFGISRDFRNSVNFGNSGDFDNFGNKRLDSFLLRTRHRPRVYGQRQQHVPLPELDNVRGVVSLGNASSEQGPPKLSDFKSVQVPDCVSELLRRRLRQRHEPVARELGEDAIVIDVGTAQSFSSPRTSKCKFVDFFRRVSVSIRAYR
jgi:hypothetical protein